MSANPYDLTARCRDLDELVSAAAGEVALAIPDGDLDRLCSAVAARRIPGALLQEKIDGCFAALHVGAGGVVESVTSRSGLQLLAAAGWIGQRLHPFLSGWTLCGEAECGTRWAAQHRDDNPMPIIHLYAAIDSRGRRVSQDRVRGITLRHGHPRIAYINEAGHGDDWATWMRGVLAAGGEGVVVRLPNGTCYRAKPRLTVDRVVAGARTQTDRNGDLVRVVDLAYSDEAGRLHSTQTALVPSGLDRELRPGRVVVVVGASMDRASGVVRHARIVDVREADEKLPAECSL